MDMIQQDHIGIGIGIGMIHSDHIGIGMDVSVEPYNPHPQPLLTPQCRYTATDSWNYN